MELVIGILGAGIGSGLMAILLAWFQRKWKKEDASEDKLSALVTAQKVIMIDRVRWLGRMYIDAGHISLEDKENLKDMHKAYKALGGNGHLQTVMDEVDRLPVVVQHEG